MHKFLFVKIIAKLENVKIYLEACFSLRTRKLKTVWDKPLNRHRLGKIDLVGLGYVIV